MNLKPHWSGAKSRGIAGSEVCHPQPRVTKASEFPSLELTCAIIAESYPNLEVLQRIEVFPSPHHRPLCLCDQRRIPSWRQFAIACYLQFDQTSYYNLAPPSILVNMFTSIVAIVISEGQ